MAGPTISDSIRRCNMCVSYEPVSLTYEHCRRLARPVLREDVACGQWQSVAPWSGWLLPTGDLRSS